MTIAGRGGDDVRSRNPLGQAYVDRGLSGLRVTHPELTKSIAARADESRPANQAEVMSTQERHAAPGSRAARERTTRFVGTVHVRKSAPLRRKSRSPTSQGRGRAGLRAGALAVGPEPQLGLGSHGGGRA